MGTDQPSARTPVVAIVGLDGLGVELGLALQQVKSDFTILGHDREPERAKAARKEGAIDRASWNLIEVAAAGDLIILTEPLGQLMETLETIAPHVRPGTLITDTAGTKAELQRLAEAVVPEGVSFIGGHPILRPTAGEAAEAPGQRLRGAAYCLIPLPSASQTALRVLVNLVGAIGARPFFIDAQEHDALCAGVSALPYLFWAAWMHVLEGSPSRQDLHRLAGGSGAELLGLAADGQQAARDAILANPGGLVPWLEQVLILLGELQAALASGRADEVAAFLGAAERARQAWQAIGPDEPAASGFDALEEGRGVRNIFFGRLGQPPDRR